MHIRTHTHTHRYSGEENLVRSSAGLKKNELTHQYVRTYVYTLRDIDKPRSSAGLLGNEQTGVQKEGEKEIYRMRRKRKEEEEGGGGGGQGTVVSWPVCLSVFFTGQFNQSASA